jgi:hypothetical protein
MTRDLELPGVTSITSSGDDIKPVEGGPVTFINIFEVHSGA